MGCTHSGRSPGRRDDFVERYFRRAQPDQVVAIIKAREPATIMTAIGKDDRWHLEMKRRWVEQYNFYVQDSRWGQMFVRVCPHFPFSARVCLNQHYWLALRMQKEGIRFQQCANAFVQCSDPEALQKLADSLAADEMISCAQKWLTRFTPFFTSEERKHACVQHRLFFAQIEYCDNLIFRRRAAVDALEQRLLDASTSATSKKNALAEEGAGYVTEICTRGKVLEAPLAELPKRETGTADDVVGTNKKRIPRKATSSPPDVNAGAEEYERKQREEIIQALTACKGRTCGADGAAIRLGIARTTLI